MAKCRRKTKEEEMHFDYGFRDFGQRSAGSLAFGPVVGQKPSKDGAQSLPSQ